MENDEGKYMKKRELKKVEGGLKMRKKEKEYKNR
jgi:hypothetical protein